MKSKTLLILLAVLVGGCATLPRRPVSAKYFGLRDVEIQLNPLSWAGRGQFEDGQAFYFLVGSDVVYYAGSFHRLSQRVILKNSDIFFPKNILGILKKPSKSLSYLEGFRIDKVVVDPGHGGKDPGAVSPRGVREKDVVLDIALRLRKILEKAGVKVIMTREKDRFLSLRQRAQIANTSGAQLFLSIHANANRSRYLKGFEVYYYSRYPSGPEAKITQILENSVESFRDDRDLEKRGTVKGILWDLVRSENRAESLKLARYFCRSIQDLGMIRVRGIKSANFYVLRNILIPSLLVEVGYLTNPQEEKFIRSSYFRQHIANALAQAILGFNKEFEKVLVRQ